jgi:hypothetical protein
MKRMPAEDDPAPREDPARDRRTPPLGEDISF